MVHSLVRTDRDRAGLTRLSIMTAVRAGPLAHTLLFPAVNRCLRAPCEKRLRWPVAKPEALSRRNVSEAASSSATPSGSPLRDQPERDLDGGTARQCHHRRADPHGTVQQPPAREHRQLDGAAGPTDRQALACEGDHEAVPRARPEAGAD